jgi:hypothetical protein
MDPLSPDLQWKIREQLSPSVEVAPAHGYVKAGDALQIRWNTQHGIAYVDGHYVTHSFELGDGIIISSTAPPLMLY